MCINIWINKILLGIINIYECTFDIFIHFHVKLLLPAYFKDNWIDSKNNASICVFQVLLWIYYSKDIHCLTWSTMHSTIDKIDI